MDDTSYFNDYWGADECTTIVTAEPIEMDFEASPALSPTVSTTSNPQSQGFRVGPIPGQAEDANTEMFPITVVNPASNMMQRQSRERRKRQL